MEIRDYNLWTAEWVPVFLVLYDATRRRAYWMFVQRYFAEDPRRKPKAGAKTIRVRVPQTHVLSGKAIARMRAWKSAVRQRILGE